MWKWFSGAAVSSETADWMAECFSWAMQNFDVERFRNATPLILPTDKFFPQRIDNPAAMAHYILQQVVSYSGLQSWPWRLVPDYNFEPVEPPLLGLSPAVRGDDASGLNLMMGENGPQELVVAFTVDQITKPQDLVASMAHGVAQHMLWQSQLIPPGGPAYFLQATEVLAVFMGFGVMVTNSAYNFRGSCARCYNPRANRQSSLSESECLYALTLFCQLKKIDRRDAGKYLKKYLLDAFKTAERQVNKHPCTSELLQLSV